MSNVHMKSGASNSSPFATWAGAATTLAAAAAAVAAGDDLLLSPTYAEATAGISVTIPGTAANPTRMLCGTEGATSGITAISSGAVIESTNTTFSISGNFYADGVTFRASSSSSVAAYIAAGSGNVEFLRNCRFELTGTNINAVWHLGSVTGNGSSFVDLRDPVFKFGAAQQRIQLDYAVNIVGGSIDGSGSAPTALFNLSSAGRGAKLRSEGFDASNAASSMDLVGTITAGGTTAIFKRAKMPASWSGSPVASGQLRVGDRVELIDYSVGTTLFKAWIMDYAGSIRDESTIKVTAQSRSYKMASGANCGLATPLRSIEFFVPLSGAAQTVSLDVCTDGVTLTDRDCWIEIDHLASATSALSSRVTDAAASVITAGTNQTTSSTPWTTAGLASPVRQVLSAGVTAGAASHAIVRVWLVKPSTTVYLADTPTVA